MGQKISVDKHTSNIDDILQTNPENLKDINLDRQVPDDLTQHLKIWKFFDSGQKVSSDQVSLNLLISSEFQFLQTECYLILLIYKKKIQRDSEFLSFPHCMWGLVESYSNLTPRGLAAPVSSSENLIEINTNILESFLMPNRQQSEISNENQFEYLMFVWNGNQANPITKVTSLKKAFELENLIHKGSNELLKILFSGGVFQNKKLKKGKIVQLENSSSKNENRKINENEFQNIKETVYLLKFLFPMQEKNHKNEIQNHLKNIEQLISNSNQNSVNHSRDKQNFQNENNVQKAKSKVPHLNLPLQNQQQQEQIVLNLNYEKQQEDSQKQQEASLKEQDQQLEKNLELNVKQVSQFEMSENQDDESNTNSLKNQNIDESKKESNIPFDKKLNIGLTNLQLENVFHPKIQMDFGNLTWEDIKDDQSNLMNLNEKDRRFLKMNYFSKICSEVVKDSLYVGGEIIAYNKDILLELGITHIINCAGDVCENKFPENFVYKTYFLKDAKQENIECVFYDSLFFIDYVLENNGKVLVHCIQGVSRSITICIAYLIFKQKISYDDAYLQIKQARGVANPNIGFTVQLLIFYKRLYESFDSIPVNPRVFCISSHQIEQPDLIIARLLMDQLYITNKKLDPRGVFIIYNPQYIYIWVGDDCQGERRNQYIDYAFYYINIIKNYENGPQVDPIMLYQEKESIDFWQLWGFENPEEIKEKYEYRKEWNNYFIETIFSQRYQVSNENSSRENFSKNQINSHRSFSELDKNLDNQFPVLYFFPNSKEGIKIMDFDDLNEEIFCVLCIETSQQRKIFIWKGDQFHQQFEEETQFIQDVVNQHWGNIELNTILLQQEEPHNETDEFLQYFQ